MSIIRRIYKQGNSLVISVPAYVWSDIDAELGDRVEIRGLNGIRLEISFYEKGVATEVKTEGKAKQ